MKRFNVVSESKFERMSESELSKITGGCCISCMKRDRKVEIGDRFGEGKFIVNFNF